MTMHQKEFTEGERSDIVFTGHRLTYCCFLASSDTPCQVQLLKHSLWKKEGKRRHELVEVDVVKIAGWAVRINPVEVVLKPYLHFMIPILD